MKERNINLRTLVSIFFVCCLAVIFAIPAVAFADEAVTSLDSDIEIKQDSSIIVTEEITYDFDDNSRHGIFRDIPVDYDTDTGNRSILLDVVSVTRDGNPEPYTISKQGDDKRIKVGDPDETITGEHSYTITYNVKAALNYFDNYDELYWNVTGHNWDVPINQVSANIVLPGQVSANNLQTACYAGPEGSDTACSQISAVGSSSVVAEAERLSAGEGLTVAVGFPKRLISEPLVTQKAWWWLMANWIMVFPGVVFIVMLYLWFRYGRDPDSQTIMAQYEPPEDMLPTLVGALINESVDDRDITAGIIYLAQQGFLTLTRKEETQLVFFDSVDYAITLDRPVEQAPTDTLQDILDMLFGSGASVGTTVTVSDMKNDRSVARKIKTLKKDVYKEMTDRDFFVSNPRKRVGSAWVGGILLLLVMGVLTAVFENIWYLASGGVSAAIIVGFGYLMPKKTEKGARTKEHVLGFEHFLTMTQENRLEFHNAPERTPEEFMEYLPYAIAMGVETEWAEQFSDIYIETPDWYAGDVSGRVAATAFANDLTDATGGISSGVSSAASGGSGSTGGGSAGGGIGGGGGGSW
jgi:uncharacterized membrane protein